MKKETKESIRDHRDLFTEFFKLGLFTIGGGMAMLPLIQKIAVEDKHWLSEEDMIDCIALSQALPGVIAINSATYIGKRLRGITGSLVATFGVVLPSFLIIILLTTLLGSIGENQYLENAFTGIKAAVCGLVLVSAWKLGKQIMKDPFCWIVGVSAFVVIGIFRITAVWGILAGAAVGIVYHTVRMRLDRKQEKRESTEIMHEESRYEALADKEEKK